MHCDAFSSSLRTSLHLSTLGLAARSAVARGQPLDPAEEHCPSDSLVFLGATCNEAALESKISHELMARIP
jgi:hypothetical protein